MTLFTDACCGAQPRATAHGPHSRARKSATPQVTPFVTHKLEEGPSNQVTTNKAELLKFFRSMYTMRRMEIAADMMYKAKMIRGFCHL